MRTLLSEMPSKRPGELTLPPCPALRLFLMSVAAAVMQAGAEDSAWFVDTARTPGAELPSPELPQGRGRSRGVSSAMCGKHYPCANTRTQGTCGLRRQLSCDSGGRPATSDAVLRRLCWCKSLGTSRCGSFPRPRSSLLCHSRGSPARTGAAAPLPRAAALRPRFSSELPGHRLGQPGPAGPRGAAPGLRTAPRHAASRPGGWPRWSRLRGAAAPGSRAEVGAASPPQGRRSRAGSGWAAPLPPPPAPSPSRERCYASLPRLPSAVIEAQEASPRRE